MKNCLVPLFVFTACTAWCADVTISPRGETPSLAAAVEKVRALRAAGKDIPSIYLAIGTEDSLYGANQEFRRFLEAQGADFCYEEGPGGHNWTFWNRYIDRGLGWVLRP